MDISIILLQVKYIKSPQIISIRWISAKDKEIK